MTGTKIPSFSICSIVFMLIQMIPECVADKWVVVNLRLFIFGLRVQMNYFFRKCTRQQCGVGIVNGEFNIGLGHSIEQFV